MHIYLFYLQRHTVVWKTSSNVTRVHGVSANPCDATAKRTVAMERMNLTVVSCHISVCSIVYSVLYNTDEDSCHLIVNLSTTLC